MRCTPSNGPFKGGDDDLRVCFWNAGSLNNSKFLEVKNILFKFDADAFFIVEAGSCCDIQYLETLC
jgi:hypothetical protein